MIGSVVFPESDSSLEQLRAQVRHQAQEQEINTTINSCTLSKLARGEEQSGR